MLADMEEFLRKVNSSEVFKLYAERLAVYGPFLMDILKKIVII